jgi:hypothetical protein
LGSGCGLSGIVAARYAKEVYLTDYIPQVIFLPNTQHTTHNTQHTTYNIQQISLFSFLYNFSIDRSNQILENIKYNLMLNSNVESEENGSNDFDILKEIPFKTRLPLVTKIRYLNWDEVTFQTERDQNSNNNNNINIQQVDNKREEKETESTHKIPKEVISCSSYRI